MTNPLIVYIVITVALSLLNTIILMRVQPKSVNAFYPSTFYAIMITNFGFLFQAMSTNLQEALLANKIVFVGGTYLPIFVFMALASLCHFKVPNALRILMFSISGIIFLTVIGSGYTDILYRSAELVSENGISKIKAEYGIGYVLFGLQLVGYGVAYLSIILYSMFHKKNVSIHSLCSLAFIASFTLISFAISKRMGVEYVVMPGVFLVDEYILLILVHRMGKYDIETTILNSLIQTNTSAYVTFSKSKRYIGCNDIALKFFPQMKDFRVDHPLENKSDTEKTFSKLIDQFNPESSSKVVYFQLGKNHYKGLIKHLFHGNSDCGYMMRIEDDTKMQRYIKFLDKYNNELVNDVQTKDSHIHDMQEQMIVGMANMVENRDSNTGGHIKRTSQVIRILISEMRKDKSLGLTNKFCRAVVKAAPMHDLGKIAVDDMILRKPGKFTSEEYSIMKTHAEKGAAIVENLLQGIEDPELVTIAKNIANYHHELWNGDGYPKHLKGTEIPLEARIMAIADVYDALVSQRCYKEKISCEDAYEIIINSMGTHFDPALKPYFVNCREELEAYYSTALAS